MVDFEAVKNPGPVAWYCALRLEMSMRLTVALITIASQNREAPGADVAKACLREELSTRLGDGFDVETFELAAEGMASRMLSLHA